MNGSEQVAKVVDVRVPGIRTTELACRRGDRILFRKMSFDVGPGEALHITGANGAGKTTLIRTLAELTTPYAGGAACGGTPGLLDERTGLDPERSLGAALDFWFSIDRVTEKSVILERLRLHELVDVPVRYLSTGQRKRAALARLLGQDALVWLLDEPLSGLDAASQNLVCTLITEHLAAGRSALVASHQPLDVPNLQTLAMEDFVVPLEAPEGWEE
ncbi:MAG: heme ABC exporter ATP-binding protein CcmA [Pseudomonadota bacterium]